MRMQEGEIVVVRGRGGVERSVHTMYMAYTQSCAEHMRHRSRGGEGKDKAFGDGCWMGYRGEQGEASTSTRGRGFDQLPGKGGGRGERHQTTCKEQIWSATTTAKIWEFVTLFKTNETEKRHSLGFCEKIFKNAFKQAYLWGRFFFFLISARQGVTITEICESGCKFWRKHLSTCRQVKLDPCSLPYNTCRSQNKSEIWENKLNMLLFFFFFFSFFSKASQETGGQNQQPSPHMQGAGLITTDGFLKQTCSLSLYLSLSLTLSCLRGVVQSVTLERYLFLPFLAGFRDPSSEKLTGPVQFPVSSPLSRLNCCELVRKWGSLYGV